MFIITKVRKPHNANHGRDQQDVGMVIKLKLKPLPLTYRNNGIKGAALLYDVNTLFTRTTDLDPMDRRSSGCDCFKFVGETPAFCCGNGQHTIISHPPHADYLQRLFDGSDVNSEHFLANIRKYNCAFQMTSKSNNDNYVTSNIITYVFGVIAIPEGASLESYNYLHTMITI